MCALMFISVIYLYSESVGLQLVTELCLQVGQLVLKHGDAHHDDILRFESAGGFDVKEEFVRLHLPVKGRFI